MVTFLNVSELALIVHWKTTVRTELVEVYKPFDRACPEPVEGLRANGYLLIRRHQSLRYLNGHI